MRIKTTHYALTELATKATIVAGEPDLLEDYGIDKGDAEDAARALELFAIWPKGPTLDTSAFPEKVLVMLRHEAADAALVQTHISARSTGAELPKILRGARELRNLGNAIRSAIVGGPA